MAPVATPELEVIHTRAAGDGWAEIAADAKKYGHVLVTTEGKPDVVVVSMDEYERLHQKLVDAAMAKVRAEIDQQVAIMNAPGSHERWRAIMDATPQEIADAVNAAEAKQRRNG